MSNEEYWHKIQVAEQESLSDGEVASEDVPETRLQALKKRIQSHDLPIRSRLEEVEARVEEAVARSGMFLLLGETGSGKSIYSPLAVRNVLKKLGLPDKIIVLQPRRDAAKGVAEAHCAVTDGELGRDVGYSTSETKMVDCDTPVRVVTSGILPRYLFNGTVDNTNTGAIILDEVHEGSIDYHYVFGLLKELRAEGKAPFVFLTSATVDPKKFQEFFGFDEQDFMRVEGRTFPVEIEYSEKESSSEKQVYGSREIARGYVEETAGYVRQAIESEREGDILVFLPGAREIDDCIERLADIEGIEILPLHGGLSFDERNRALSGERDVKARRRVIVATNVAETSVTVPNVTIVVDSCRRHSMKYDPVAGISRKVTEYISKEEAWQRAGRAGRVEEGVCFRALTQAEFDRLPKHAVTEIERTNLAHLILRLRGYGHDPETFPFFVQPNKAALHAGVEQLKILDALDTDGHVTAIGERMLEMPFKPEDARMLVEAEDRGCVDAALTLALFTREQYLFVYPTAEEIDRAPGYFPEEKKKNARAAIAQEQAQFEQDGSDWAKRLNIFIQAIDAGVFECLGDERRPEVKRATREFREWCRIYHLNPEALRHIAYRLYAFSREAGADFDRFELKERLKYTDPGALNASILAGYQERLLMRQETSRLPAYIRLQGDGFQEINFSPDSSAFARPPEFCIAESFKEGAGTAYRQRVKRNYASQIHPASLEDVVRLMGDKLLKKPRGEEVEFDATLGRAVQMIDYYLPREVYSAQYLGALGVPVEGEQATRKLAEVIVTDTEAMCDAEGNLPAFWEKNIGVINTLRKLRERSLGQVSLPNEVEWYVKRLGHVTTREEVWRMSRFLEMDIREFCSDEQRAQIERDYPETIEVCGSPRELTYQVYPGDIHRGLAEHTQVVMQLYPQEIRNIPVGTRFEVGPMSVRQPVALQMYFDQERHSSTSLEVLRGLLGDPALSYELQKKYRTSKRMVQEMLNNMEAERETCGKVGFTREEFEAALGQMRWCEEQLDLVVADESEGKRRIEEVLGIVQAIQRLLLDKQSEQRERRERKVEGLRIRYQEVQNRLEQASNRLLGTLYEALASRLSDGLTEIPFDVERASAIVQAVTVDLDQAESMQGGLMRTAFQRANRRSVSQEVPEQAGQPTQIMEKQKRAVAETVMTPEIKFELGDEIVFLEAIVESIMNRATPILAEPQTKIKTKAQEAAERVMKRKELRRELKDLLKEIETEESVAVVRGHVRNMHDSVYALVKANMHHMVVGYDATWVEVFRSLWNDVPRRVSAHEDAKEYIESGLVTHWELVQDVRTMLKARIPALQTGKGDEGSLDAMIGTALDRY